MTYKENIERLRGRGRYNLNQRWRNANARINYIEEQEKEAIGNINKASDLLVGKSFGSTDLASGEGGLIPYKFGEYLTEQEKIGIEAEKADRARKVEALEQRLTEVSDIDTAHLNVKQDMLLNGYLYEDADRFAKLSPHAQVAYARRKLGIWKESVGSKLNYKLAKDNTEYTLKDWPDPLTSEKIHNDPNIPPVVKEAFVNRILEDLIKENGINGFSTELLELEQINDYVDPRTGEIKNGAHSTAKKGVMDKYRTIYNVTSSQNQRIELFENFKSDKNLTKLISGLAGTLDNKEDPLGPLGAWQEAEKLFVSWLMSGDITKGELYTIFDNAPSPIKIKDKKQVYLNSHRKRLQNIINEYARQKQLRDRANKITSDAKADAKKQESLLRLDKGGDLYNYLFVKEKIDDLPFNKRAEIVNATLTNLQTDWIDAGGDFEPKPGANFAPWLTDVYNDLVFTDQGELIGNATVKLNANIPLLPSDLEGMNAASIATLQRHKNWAQNQGLIQKTALQYRKVTPSGEAGYELTIPNMVKSALKTAKRDDKNPALVDYLTKKNIGVYQAAWDEAWLDKSGTMTGNKAFEYAMGKVRYNLGLGPDANGKERKGGDVDKDLEWKIKETEKKDITREVNRGQYLADLLDKQNESSDENITEQEYWIPSLGPDSIEFKQLLAYAEGKGGKIPEVYNWIAGYMPNHTAEDLAAWQLAQIGKVLPTTSAVNEAMKLTETIAGFNRLIGFKTNSTDLHQAKINAIDGLRERGYSTTPTWETGLKFDKDGKPIHPEISSNPNYMGNDLKGWLETYGPAQVEDDDSQLSQINFESDRLNTIYNEKGFHDEDPGPEPSLKNYPLQPGDEATSVIVNGIPTLAPYNEKAWQEDVNAWKEKKSLYRPLTKIETTGGRAKSRYTTYFNPETDTYEKQDIQSRLFPEEKDTRTDREKMSAFRQQKYLDARLERAAAQPDSKVVNVHRTDDGRYIQGPITVYKHVDEGGRVQYKLKPPGSASNLQSFWNIPGSPVLSPALQEYAMGLYNTNLQTA